MSRSRRWVVRSISAGLLVPLVALGLTAPPALAATSSSPITFVYDAGGRLQAVIDPSTATPAVAKYNYDNNGNLLSIARTSPTGVTIVDFHGKTGAVGEPVTIYGTGFNTTTTQNKVTFTKSGGSGNTGAQATVTSATSTVLEVTIPTGAIAGTIWVKNLGTNKTATSTQEFAPSPAAPTITGFTDMAGAAITRPGFNTQMKITGTGFSTIAGANVVTFNNVRSIVDTALSTATTLVVSTPPFTTTGAVEVRTPDGKARSATDLVFPSTTLAAADLTPIKRVTIGGASTSVTVSQEQAAMVMFEGTKGQIVQVSFSNYTGTTSEKVSLREPFDRELAGVLLYGSTASMSATLPQDGDYAIRVFNDFQPTPWSVNVSVSQTGMASRVSTSASEGDAFIPDAAALEAVRLNGPVTPEVWVPDAESPSGWLTGEEESVFESTRPLQAAGGTTGIFGRVLSLDGLPLGSVPIRVLEAEGVDHAAESETVTDELGRFLLEDVPAGRVVIYVDGAALPRDDIRFGSFPIGIDVERGRTAQLEAPVWLPRIDTSTTTEIGSPTRKEVVLTHAAMPGFEVHVPRGTRVKTIDGESVHELTLTPIPLDRPPFPMPEGANPPAYWTVQPGGATLWPKGARVVYPAPDMSVPGQRQGFYTYEPDEGWEGYGYGTVDASGQQVFPNRDARVDSLTGATIWGSNGGWFADVMCFIQNDPLSELAD
ncbi:MAG: hypothetical protein OEV60_11150, partial [Actinomycetota bacterium]|nr:hypothetical protein [Actinomycetota bacterium]